MRLIYYTTARTLTLTALVFCFCGGAAVSAAKSGEEVASWVDLRNQQEWRLLSVGARWQAASKICRNANMKLPRIETLQDAQPNLISVSAGQKALEVSELVWSADSWTGSSNDRPGAVAMSMRNGENTSVGKNNLLPVLCVRDLSDR
jgi:hypothetical protein